MKKNCYIDYWKKRREEIKKLNLRLQSEARKELSKIISLLVEKYDAQRIILFGSLKTGDFNESSDIDLAVEGIKAENFFQALAAVNRISRFPIDVKPLEELEPYFRSRIDLEGEVIYERYSGN